MPQSLRSEFKKAYGEIFSSVDNIEKLVENKLVITVGDIISYNMIKAGYKPKLIIFDKRVNKQPTPIQVRAALETFEGKTFHVRNPPSGVTEELQSAIRKALDIQGNVKIFVDGEEDMAFLPAVLECNIGDAVLYGFFDKGFVLTNVDIDLKRKMKEFFNRFEGS